MGFTPKYKDPISQIAERWGFFFLLKGEGMELKNADMRDII